MKAEELRVSNIVGRIWYNPNPKGTTKEVAPCIVKEVRQESVNITTCIKRNERMKVSYDSIVPLPLTEEWLLKFGFEKANDIDSFYKTELNNNTKLFYSFKWSLCEISISGLGFNMKHIKSVHQLQNLYFALTGTELTLNQ